MKEGKHEIICEKSGKKKKKLIDNLLIIIQKKYVFYFEKIGLPPALI